MKIILLHIESIFLIDILFNYELDIKMLNITKKEIDQRSNSM
jgi:hypothetical protein